MKKNNVVNISLFNHSPGFSRVEYQFSRKIK